MKMRKIFSLAALAALVIGAASCSKEIDNGLEGQDGKQALQFSINNGKGALVTYAIAEDAQWTINTVDVYAFSGGNRVGAGKMTPGTDYTISSDLKTATATPAWLSTVTGQTVTFYFVANDASSKGGAHITGTVPATEAEFKELLTNKLAGPDGEGKYDLITPVLLFSDVVADVPLVGKVQKDVKLIRRDARFDIFNDMPASVVINKIYVSNANVQGHIFGTATGVNTPATGSHKAITGPTVYNASNLATSVFHLYPTTLGKASEGKTEMVIEATVGGVKQNFVLNGAMEIVANHRYILRLDPISLTFSITPEDYEDGGSIVADLGEDDAIALGNFAGTGYDNYYGATVIGVYDFDATTGQTLTFEATSKYGTEAVVEYLHGDRGSLTQDIVVAAPVTTTTYAGFQTVDKYTITAPAATTGVFGILVTIKSKNGTGQKAILFQRGVPDFTELFPDPIFRAVIEDMTGAYTLADLFNVTDCTIDDYRLTSLAGIENLPNLQELKIMYSNDLTEVDLTKNPLLKSIYISGLKLNKLDLSNNPLLEEIRLSDLRLLELDLSNNPLLTKFTCYQLYGGMPVLDLTKNPLLKSINMSESWEIGEVKLNNPLLEELDLHDATPPNRDLDLSNFPLLTKLSLGMLGISSLDISNNPLLEKIKLFDTHPSELNVSNNPLLKELVITISSLSELDLSKNDLLEKVEIYQMWDITTLDISNCKALKSLSIYDCLNLTTGYVWSGFNTATPASNFTTYYVNECPVVWSTK